MHEFDDSKVNLWNMSEDGKRMKTDRLIWDNAKKFRNTGIHKNVNTVAEKVG